MMYSKVVCLAASMHTDVFGHIDFVYTDGAVLHFESSCSYTIHERISSHMYTLVLLLSIAFTYVNVMMLFLYVVSVYTDVSLCIVFTLILLQSSYVQLG